MSFYCFLTRINFKSKGDQACVQLSAEICQLLGPFKTRMKTHFYAMAFLNQEMHLVKLLFVLFVSLRLLFGFQSRSLLILICCSFIVFSCFGGYILFYYIYGFMFLFFSHPFSFYYFPLLSFNSFIYIFYFVLLYISFSFARLPLFFLFYFVILYSFIFLL